MRSLCSGSVLYMSRPSSVSPLTSAQARSSSVSCRRWPRRGRVLASKVIAPVLWVARSVRIREPAKSSDNKRGSSETAPACAEKRRKKTIAELINIVSRECIWRKDACSYCGQDPSSESTRETFTWGSAPANNQSHGGRHGNLQTCDDDDYCTSGPIVTKSATRDIREEKSHLYTGRQVPP